MLNLPQFLSKEKTFLSFLLFALFIYLLTSNKVVKKITDGSGEFWWWRKRKKLNKKICARSRFSFASRVCYASKKQKL